MVEVYDRDKTAALLKEARDITVDLKSEMHEIATQISHVLDGREEGADEIEGHAPDVDNQASRGVVILTAALQESSAGKSFWQFWR